MKKSDKNFYLIINDAGKSVRFNKSNSSIDIKKEHQIICDNLTVLELSILSIIKVLNVKKIFIVYNRSFYDETKKILENNSSINSFDLVYIQGCNNKISGTFKALKVIKKIANPYDIVITHDAARPNPSENLIKELSEQIINNDACVPYLNINDSLRVIKNKNINYINRDTVIKISTPQFFKFDAIIKAFQNTNITNVKDESQLLLKNKENKIKIIKSNEENIKLTTIRDLEIIKLDYKRLREQNENSIRI